MFLDSLRSIAKQSQVYGINLSQDKSRLVILGPVEKLKGATITADVFLNHQRQLNMNVDQQSQNYKAPLNTMQQQ